jgi:hypothetical protein
MYCFLKTMNSASWKADTITREASCDATYQHFHHLAGLHGNIPRADSRRFGGMQRQDDQMRLALSKLGTEDDDL